MLYDSNKMDYKDGHRQIYAYYKMVQFIISARDENVEHDTQHFNFHVSIIEALNSN